MPEKVVKLPAMTRQVDFVPATLNKEARTIEVVWSKGAPVLRSGWDGPFYEELSLDPEHVKLGRLNNGAPFLMDHQSWSGDAVIGVVEKAWVENGEGRAQIKLSKRAEVEPILEDIADGIRRNISIGYSINKFAQVPSGDAEIPTYRAVDWEPYEISLVPAGADDGAKVRAAEQSENNCTVQMEELKMPEPIQNSAPVDTGVEQKERNRAASISKMVRVAKLDPSFAETLISEGVSIESASDRVFAEIEKRQATVVSAPSVSIVRDETETRREGVRDAILSRVNPAAFSATEKGRQFVGMSAIELCRALLGQQAAGMTKSQIARAAISTSDMASIVADVATKSLQKGYKVQGQTFRPLVTIGNLPDYKEATRVKFGEVSDLSEVKENGEYTFATLKDGGEKIKLAKYGKKVALTEELIINDDLSILSGLPQKFGSASMRLESKLFWDVIINNGAMSDGTDLFHSDHGNLASQAAAISETSLGVMRKAIRAQKDINSKDYLDLEPKFLICGPDKETEAKKLLATQLLGRNADYNTFAGALQLIVESRLTGNQWYGAVSPDQLDMIEMAYLDGMSGPEVETFSDRENDRVIVKCKHVVGVKALDWKGLFKNAGA